MKKILLVVCVMTTVFYLQADAQTRVNKNKKSKYFKNNTDIQNDVEFDIEGFEKNYDSRDNREEVETKTKHQVYEVNIRSTEEVGKYQDERKIETVKEVMTAPAAPKKAKKQADVVNENDNKGILKKKKNTTLISNERVIYMTENERDYATTVVRKRYTSLDILADDLDVSKYQRPVFKGICSECDADVDRIITDKNLSSLEKNYKLKQAYMLRDKRLRETLDAQQYKKWHRIKDEDEYLILTKDPELIDGVYK